MRAHLVQFNIRWEDRDRNFETVRALLKEGEGVRPGDLIVLPEMFDTGFSLNTETTADRDGRTLGFLKDLARETGATVQGGRTVVEAGETMATNRAPVVLPGGEVAAEYRKIHPFGFGREPERFIGGTDVVTYWWEATERGGDGGGGDGMGGRGDGGNGQAGKARIRVCPAICYDLRFPELFRRGVRMGAELFALGANWPEARQMHWRTLLIARAIENQAYVLGVNRTGKDPFLTYGGGSIAVDPYGTIVGELTDEEAVLRVDVKADAPASWREKFSAVRDMKLA